MDALRTFLSDHYGTPERIGPVLRSAIKAFDAITSTAREVAETAIAVRRFIETEEARRIESVE